MTIAPQKSGKRKIKWRIWRVVADFTFKPSIPRLQRKKLTEIKHYFNTFPGEGLNASLCVLGMNLTSQVYFGYRDSNLGEKIPNKNILCWKFSDPCLIFSYKIKRRHCRTILTLRSEVISRWRYKERLGSFATNYRLPDFVSNNSLRSKFTGPRN